MEIAVEHVGAVQFEIRAGQHPIVCDQPEANGGFDQAMKPPQLMLASLGSCVGYYSSGGIPNGACRRSRGGD
jgi:putative redox protein